MGFGQTPSVSSWKQGDRVRFVLGGPVMLVRGHASSQSSTQETVCQWFTQDHRLQEGKFLAEHLVEVDAPPSQ